MQQQTLLKNPYDTYKTQGVLTANPMDLIVMLYNGLKKCMVLAKRAIDDKHDMETAHNQLIKAQRIVDELINSLDMSFEISQNLLAIYDFLLRGLVDINASKKTEAIDSLIEIVDELRDAWQQVRDSQKGQLHVKEG